MFSIRIIRVLIFLNNLNNICCLHQLCNWQLKRMFSNVAVHFVAKVAFLCVCGNYFVCTFYNQIFIMHQVHFCDNCTNQWYHTHRVISRSWSISCLSVCIAYHRRVTRLISCMCLGTADFSQDTDKLTNIFSSVWHIPSSLDASLVKYCFSWLRWGVSWMRLSPRDEALSSVGDYAGVA